MLHVEPEARSPSNRTSRRSGNLPTSSDSMRKIDGTAWNTVIRVLPTHADNDDPSPWRSNGATVAPFSSAPNSVDTVPLKLGF